MAKKKKSIINRKIIIALAVVLVTGILITAYNFYRKIYLPNVSFHEQKELFIYIPTGSSFTDVMNILNKENLLRNPASFEWVAEQMKYKNKIKPGKYRIARNMNNRELVSLLRSGTQVPVKVIFPSVRTLPQLASVVSSQLEADSAAITGLLTNENFLKKYGFRRENAMALFIPNTYEFYWNTNATQFVERMAKEYKKFWSQTRIQKAAAIGLSQTEVSVLASIVEQETYRNDEKSIIAGVYMNRYNKGWKLEADPTLIFAAGDFTIQRVLNIHKEIDSPYNTYLNTGFPPGPICIPSVASLDAVLNYSKHDYMFFCAREDFSGYHSFAVSYSQHLLNARRFQNELNRRKIRS
jgi:UPF0755 protein